MFRPALAATVALLCPFSALFAQQPADPPTFEQQVRPLLKTYCFSCHGEGDELSGGLDLRLRRLIVAGGESGPAVKPGERDKSLLYQRIAKGKMPPGERKRLTPQEVELIGRWIATGAKASDPEPEKP